MEHARDHHGAGAAVMLGTTMEHARGHHGAGAAVRESPFLRGAAMEQGSPLRGAAMKHARGRRARVAVLLCSRLVQLHLRLNRVRRPRLLRGLVRLVGLES